MVAATPIMFGLVLGLVDVVVLSMLKMKHNGQLTGWWVLPLAFIVYGAQALIFYKALDVGTLTAMNIMWDVTSDVLVTIIGLYCFKEAVSRSQKIGIVLAITAIILMK